MIIWSFFQTSDNISRYKKSYLPNALCPVSFTYLDLYCVSYCFIYIQNCPLNAQDNLVVVFFI